MVSVVYKFEMDSAKKRYSTSATPAPFGSWAQCLIAPTALGARVRPAAWTPPCPGALYTATARERVKEEGSRRDVEIANCRIRCGDWPRISCSLARTRSNSLGFRRPDDYLPFFTRNNSHSNSAQALLFGKAFLYS